MKGHASARGENGTNALWHPLLPRAQGPGKKWHISFSNSLKKISFALCMKRNKFRDLLNEITVTLCERKYLSCHVKSNNFHIII